MTNRFLSVFSFAVLLGMILGCSSEEKEDNNDELNKDKKQGDVFRELSKVRNSITKGNLTLDKKQLGDILEHTSLSKGDEIVKLLIHEDEISILVDISDKLEAVKGKLSDRKWHAKMIYSGMSEELLNYDGWEVLTVEFITAGVVSMDRSQREVSQYGDFMSEAEIERQLGI